MPGHLHKDYWVCTRERTIKLQDWLLKETTFPLSHSSFIFMLKINPLLLNNPFFLLPSLCACCWWWDYPSQLHRSAPLRWSGLSPPSCSRSSVMQSPELFKERVEVLALLEGQHPLLGVLLLRRRQNITEN